jgi:hypothetical protein
MRIDKLLNNRSGNISHSRYSHLSTQRPFLLEYRKDTGWNFNELDKLSKAEAKNILFKLQQAKRYEVENDIQPPIREIVIALAADPQWPKHLKVIDTTYLFEAFLRDKFNLSETVNKIAEQ